MSEQSARPPQSQSRQPGREHEMRPEPDFLPRYPGVGRLEGKVALISGGDSGIGRAVAVLFAREGASVAIIYLEEDKDAIDTRALVEAENGDVLLLKGNIGDEAFCREAVRNTVGHFGRLDILVNNAAEQHSCENPEDIDAEQLQRTFKTNVFGYFYLTRATLAHMKEESRIINTTSVTAYRGSAHLIDYSATRGAIVAYTRSLAKALAKRCIRVNAVAPGPIWTPLIPASFEADETPGFGEGTPLGRAGQPADVAPCYLFLACEDSSYMTGQVLHPNGGEIVGG